MRRLSEQEFEDFFQSTPDADCQENTPSEIWEYKIPKESRCKAVLASLVADHFSNVSEVVLHVEKRGVWPTEEFDSLVSAALKGYGDERTLADAPVLLFNSSERAALRDFVWIALLSGWDSHIHDLKGTFEVQTTDDEIVYFTNYLNTSFLNLEDKLASKRLEVASLTKVG